MKVMSLLSNAIMLEYAKLFKGKELQHLECWARSCLVNAVLDKTQMERLNCTFREALLKIDIVMDVELCRPPDLSFFSF